MRMLAAYKQTKNQINATTHITAGSCYTEVRSKWHVGTNGQKATISHLSARSKHKNWPWLLWSCCIAGHREVHEERNGAFSDICHTNSHLVGRSHPVSVEVRQVDWEYRRKGASQLPLTKTIRLSTPKTTTCENLILGLTSPLTIFKRGS